MPANAPKVLLRSEQSGGVLSVTELTFHRIAANITGVQPPPEAAKPIPEVITLGPPIGEPHQTDDLERRQR
jgi:hypothetical protein